MARRSFCCVLLLTLLISCDDIEEQSVGGEKGVVNANLSHEDRAAKSLEKGSFEVDPVLETQNLNVSDVIDDGLTEESKRLDALNAAVLEEKEALPLLLDALQDNSAEIRLDAVLGLKNFADQPGVLSAMLEMLDDNDDRVVLEVLEVLEEANDSRAIGKLMELADNHPDELVRELAADLAGRL